MGEYGRIWGIWEGTFGPNGVAGDNGKLWETVGNCRKNGSGKAPSEKVV